MKRADIVAALTGFLEKEGNLEDPSVLADGTDLIDSGIMDSLMLVMLVGYCEERFDCTVEPHELIEDNFRSLDRIASYIEDKIAHS